MTPEAGVADSLARRYPVFSDLLSTPLPNALYHYTQLESFLAILESGHLRASQIQFLNDSAELALAYERFETAIRIRENTMTIDGWVAKCLRDAISRSRWINVFVASFSEAVDVLSQWRAYGSVAVDFGPQQLKAMADRDPVNLRLSRVVYDADDQHKLAMELIDYCIEYQLAQRCEDPAHPPTPPTGPLGSIPVQDAMALTAPLLKHEGFEEEQEWRLIYFPVGPEPHLKPRARAKKEQAIPFVQLPLAPGGASPEIQHVLLGPTAASEANQTAVWHAIRASDFSMRGTVERSETPYRG